MAVCHPLLQVVQAHARQRTPCVGDPGQTGTLAQPHQFWFPTSVANFKVQIPPCSAPAKELGKGSRGGQWAFPAVWTTFGFSTRHSDSFFCPQYQDAGSGGGAPAANPQLGSPNDTSPPHGVSVPTFWAVTPACLSVIERMAESDSQKITHQSPETAGRVLGVDYKVAFRRPP